MIRPFDSSLDFARDSLRIPPRGAPRASWFIVLILLAGGLAGCGKAKPSSTLTMWLVGSEAQARTIQELSKTFTERTGVSVICEAVAWGEAHSKYLTAVAGGVQPDIGTMGLTWGAEFGRLGALVELRQAVGQDLDAIQRHTFPGLWQSIEQDGKVYGIPLDLTLQILYYRTDLIPQPPRTWEDLVDLLQRLRGEDRRMIIDWGSLSWIGYAPLLWQAGGAFYNDARTEATLDHPEAIRAAEFFRDLYRKYGVPKTSIPLEQGLRTGEFPLAMSGNWKIVSLMVGLPELDGKWAVAMLPKGPGGTRTAFLGGRILTLFAKSTRQAQAWQFVRYLFEPAVQVKLYQAALETQDAYLPPNRATWPQLPMAAAMKAVLEEQAEEAKGPPPVPGWEDATQLIETGLQRIILHDADVHEELGDVTRGMNRALERARHPER